MALTATVYADTIHRHIGSAPELKIKSFYAGAAVDYKKGDFVTIDADGRVVLATTDGQEIDGIVYGDADNLLGLDDALLVPVMLKGNVWVDGIFDATGGSFDDAATIGLAMGVAGDGGTNAAEAQALAAVPGGAAAVQFTSLCIHALPAAGTEVVKMLAYFTGSGKFC